MTLVGVPFTCSLSQTSANYKIRGWVGPQSLTIVGQPMVGMVDPLAGGRGWGQSVANTGNYLGTGTDFLACVASMPTHAGNPYHPHTTLRLRGRGPQLTILADVVIVSLVGGWWRPP